MLLVTYSGKSYRYSTVSFGDGFTPSKLIRCKSECTSKCRLSNNAVSFFGSFNVFHFISAGARQEAAVKENGSGTCSAGAADCSGIDEISQKLREMHLNTAQGGIVKPR